MKSEELLIAAGITAGVAYIAWRALRKEEGKEAPVIGGGMFGARVSSAVTRLTEPLVSVSLPSISLPSISLPSIAPSVSFSLPGAEEVKQTAGLIVDGAKKVADAAKDTAKEIKDTVKDIAKSAKTAVIVGAIAGAGIPVAYVGGKVAQAVGQAITKAPLISATTVEALPAVMPLVGTAAAMGTAAYATKKVLEVSAGAAESFAKGLSGALKAGFEQMKLRALESAVKKGKTVEELKKIFGAEQVETWFKTGVLRYAS